MSNVFPNKTGPITTPATPATPATSATPEPLWTKESAIAEYPLHALGILEESVRACAELSNAHPAVCANSFLAVASLAVQGIANVEFPNGVALPTSLFLLTIAESGDGKSTCDGFATKPLRLREEQMRRVYLEQQGKDEGSSPVYPMLTCREPTNEGLYKLLLKGHPSQGIFSDEGGQFVGGYGMRETRDSMLTSLSSLWSGGSLDRVRAGELPTSLEGRRVAIHLMFQPIIASKLVNEYTQGQGFLARCLIVAPPSMAGKRLFKKPSKHLQAVLREYDAKTLKVLQRRHDINSVDGSLKLRAIKLRPEQEEVWTIFQNQMEGRREEDREYHAIREFSSRAGEHALRLAAVLSLIENPEAVWITDKALADGITLTEFYMAEFFRISQGEMIPEEYQDAAKVLSFLKRRVSDTFVLRDLQKDGPYSLRKMKERILKALAVLVAKRWVKEPETNREPYRLLHR